MRPRHTPSAAAKGYRALPPTDFTTANPGSEEKISVMSARVERGESCFAAGEPRGKQRRSRSFHVSRFQKTHKE